MPPLVARAACLLLAAHALPAQAEEREPKDPTRLDVERLPPEAVTLKRDMFESGAYLEARLGARGFVGGLGPLVSTGLLSRVGGGYELFPFLALGVSLELSLHETRAPAPPSQTSVQLIDALAELRLRIPLSVRASIRVHGEGGVSSLLSNALESYGLEDADQLGLTYGAALGFDWHLWNPHHALGLMAGARMAPNLDDPNGDPTVAIGSALYLSYVF